MTTTTRTAAPEPRPRRAALALCALLATAGCSGARAVLPPPVAGPYSFSIRFLNVETDAAKPARICPVDAEVQEEKRNCPLKKKDCVRGKKGEVAEFQATGAAVPAYEIYFDPFKRAPLAIKGGEKATFTVAEDAPYQAYYFFVTAPGCSPLDPQIIIEN